MPNHITNELTSSQQVLDALAGENGAVDFNVIVPMPEIMRGESAEPMLEDWAKIALGITTIASLMAPLGNPADAFKRGDYREASRTLEQANVLKLLAEGPYPKNFDDERFERMVQYMRALRQFGHANWYQWSIENWGTKWNAYQIERRSERCVRFDTAWSCPLPVIEGLSFKFPDDVIRIRWADEDFGNNTGDVTLKAGAVISGDRLPDDSRESHRLALELKYDGVVPDDCRLTDDGKLEYVGD